MASFNSPLFLVLLVTISAFMASPSAVEAQLLDTLTNNLFNINGTVQCRVNETFPGGPASPFRNATVELRCKDLTVSKTTTDQAGGFSFVLGPVSKFTQITIQDFLQLGGCRVIVTTLLAECNVNLPVPGNLVSTISAGVVTTLDGVNVFNFIAGAFRWVNNNLLNA